jgi:hypothetical protein
VNVYLVKVLIINDIVKTPFIVTASSRVIGKSSNLIFQLSGGVYLSTTYNTS